MSILGNRVTRSEDPRFITGTATFGDDVELPGAMHATFVRAVLPHARITNIDTSAVSDIPGARAFTAADIGLPPLPHAMPGFNENMVREVIAQGWIDSDYIAAHTMFFDELEKRSAAG